MRAFLTSSQFVELLFSFQSKELKDMDVNFLE